MAVKGLKEETAKKWISENNRSWLEYDLTPDASRLVERLRCRVCSDERVRALRNYSNSFVEGITGSGMKKDNVKKHSRTEMHVKAIALSRGVKRTLSEIYSSTPLGKAFKKSNSDEESRVSKLIEISYMVAKEELPFSKFPSVCKTEKRHKVPLGTKYINEEKCSEFTTSIGQAFEDELVQELNQSPYITILTDGSTDASVRQSLKQTIIDAFQELGVKNMQNKLVGLCCDGASVNMGRNRGLAALLRQDSPWSQEASRTLAEVLGRLLGSKTYRMGSSRDWCYWTLLWPKNKESLTEFGKEELLQVKTHFDGLFQLHSVRTDALESEFTEMKLFWYSNLSHLSRADFWSAGYSILKTQYPNLLHVFIVLKLLPVSNAKVERAFSFMRRVKSDWRNSLSESTLNHLLRIDIDGPDFDDFDPSASVNMFFSDKVTRSGPAGVAGPSTS
ncbi:uncharacterized protein [Apostichopus japonicus]|uniref:uncharacterized protein n=1 Tax=Stichopus japonicus TaxID=307972 RepID=UPI003AB7192F